MHAPKSIPDLKLRHSGVFAARDESGAEIAGLSRRSQALLAYLSLQTGMRVERGYLADLLWSDRGEDQARASLRQELSLLRRALADGVIGSNRQHVWLDPSSVEIESADGDVFLKGFDLSSEGFEDWLREMRSSEKTPAAEEGAPDPAQIFSRPAVLLFAFEALSGGENDAMIAGGLADDLRTTLSYWRWFPVIGPEAIGWKTAKEVDLGAAAEKLNAAYAVSGTLRCLGNRVKISVSLTEAATGLSKWAETIEGSLDDFFAFQEEVSRAIVAQLEPQISRAEATRIERVRPGSILPWQLLVQADEIDRKGGEGYGTPESNFEQARLMEIALEQAPDFVPALSRLGRIYFRAALQGWLDDRDAAYSKSLSHTDRALEIDPENWEAHAYSGLVRIFGQHDYPGGQFHGMEAVRLNPSAVVARHCAGCGLEWIGKPEEALDHLNLIFRLNPTYPGRAAALGDITTCETFVGNRERAIDAARRLLSIAPTYARGLQRCVATFGYFDELELAADALAKLKAVQPEFDEAYIRETYPYARAQDLDAILLGLNKAGAFDGGA